MELKEQAKLHVMMLTGDHELSARRVANAVGIDEVHCALKPEDKLNHVTSIPRDTGDSPIPQLYASLYPLLNFLIPFLLCFKYIIY